MPYATKVVGWICALGFLLTVNSPAANANEDPSSVGPADSTAACLALSTVDFSAIADAPTQIVKTWAVARQASVPGYCQVEGYVAPNVGILLRMPLDRWNGKLLEIGCGGFCGSTDHIQQCDEPLERGYACIVSDGGHRSSTSDARWAYAGMQPIIDFLVRASHVTALAGKAVAETYYQHPPKHSYFRGCSGGGQQAMMEAQRFPWDFDGIISGQPTSETVADMNTVWGYQALTDETGASILSQRDLTLLHSAVVAKCDMNDGIRDGLIGSPLQCDFDPAELRCTSKRSSDCLSQKQIIAVRKLYSGPATSHGVPISLPGALKGSEVNWLETYIGSVKSPRDAYKFSAEPFRYYAFQPAPGSHWKPEDFDFDRDYQRLGMAEGLISSVNPDLRRFKSNGGKLISYAGWSDAGGMPLSTVDYYETVEKTLGGRVPTQEFFRLFMVPGMNHCTLGDGAFAIDYLSYLEAWVEQGRAPDALIASHVGLEDLNPDNPTDSNRLRKRLEFPLDPATVRFSRPVYPYPMTARYSGRGNPAFASSFVPDEVAGRTLSQLAQQSR